MVKKWKFLDILYPKRCAICNELLRKSDEDICSRCKCEVHPIKGSVCLRCGKPIVDVETECADCKRMKHTYDWGVSCYLYKDVREALYRIKYAGREDLISYFARQIVINLEADILQMQADFLLPIPMHRRRERRRGYNQAELLARQIGKEIQMPVLTGLVIRKVQTLPMKYLSMKQRQLNLKRAFIIGRNDVKLKTIILVDDIYTTGSTMDAVASVLKKAGAKKIYFLTLAIGKSIER